MAKDNLPIGTIMAFAGQVASFENTNWKICNGDFVYRSQYPILFTVLGDRWGTHIAVAGDIKFTLPDLRGVFLRGVNGNRQDQYKDPDAETRTALIKGKENDTGSFQTDSIKKHNHEIVAQNFAGVQVRPMAVSGNFSQADGDLDGSGRITGYDKNAVPLIIDHYGLSETRPVNAYVHYIIKVKDE